MPIPAAKKALHHKFFLVMLFGWGKINVNGCIFKERIIGAQKTGHTTRVEKNQNVIRQTRAAKIR
jgi:hypothetical protein